MFAVVTFVEKYRAYLGSEPFKLRVDNRALSWLKTYSMDQSYIGRWIVRLDGYIMIIEHRTRDKHQNADSLSKKTKFYERQQQREKNGGDKEEPEVTILRRSGTVVGKNSLEVSNPDGKEVVQSLVDKIPDDILERTRVTKKKVAFNEEAEHLGLGQESGEWPTVEEDAVEEKLSWECEEWDEDSESSSDDQDSLCMILAEEKMRHRYRELQTDPSSGTYNLDQQEMQGGEELEKIAVSRKPLRELSCNSNVRTNLVPEDDRKIMKRRVCVKLKDDIHNPGEMNGQIMAPKEHVKARYRL